MSLSVNFSVKQFLQPDLISQIASALHEFSLKPARLSVEITESVVIDKTELATQALADLKTLGVRVHLDDFGTGYSSLSYLHRLPLDGIKIDRAFINGIGKDERSTQLVRSILGLSRALDLDTVAEGVTSTRQLAQLRKLRCDFAQGFLFSPPVEADAMAALLEADPRW